MILFFGNPKLKVFAVEISEILSTEDLKKLSWVLDSSIIDSKQITEKFIGPKSSMITPWSTNAVEITRNMGVKNIDRIEVFICHEICENFDKMIHEKYKALNQSIFNNNITPEKIYLIDNLKKYNDQQGLALDDFEISYLESLSKKIGRKLTDSEVYGFSQVNSEHCRHKIFNGKFIIDGKEKNNSLFDLIKFTSKKNKNSIVSAYSDNVAFINGPKINQFQPKRGDESSYFINKEIESIISLKAETHNFPTTVEPYNGAATGSGGEIRDRAAGGTGSLPLIGSAVYMTPYSRLNNNKIWEKKIPQRDWKYQTPVDILIKASNGASDFGNCFGQPLIVGSLLTFEHDENQELYSYDKVIMLAGGVGYGELKQSMKNTPKKGDVIVLLGGDNYRIGMGGASVSSTDTGSYNNAIELNAVQRSNPEMQKRVTNTIRSLFEMDENPIVSIHDHGAGGHLNCFSELVEDVGGEIYLDSLPIGDPSLSYKEIIGNESQERIGLIIKEKDYDLVKKIAERERTPVYKVGKVTGDNKFKVIDRKNNSETINLDLDSLFGDAPKKVVNDITKASKFKEIEYDENKVSEYLENVLMLESVACKDWLTNKVDRCVTGRVAQQQTVGEIQVPLSNCGVVSLDYTNFNGIASSIGHSPISGLIDPSIGSINSIGESLTNIIWAPLKDGINSISLSANWMWPCGNEGEDSRLYKAVDACSNFAIELGINIPTGKDSLSMVQKYDELKVKSPGTVIISASGHCKNIRKVVKPVLDKNLGDIYYINLSFDDYKLGGSSFSQTLNKIGSEAPVIKDSKKFKESFNLVQNLISNDEIISGHDISSGGLITCLLELCFSSNEIGMDINLTHLGCEDSTKLLFSENTGIIIQSEKNLQKEFSSINVECLNVGKTNNNSLLNIVNFEDNFSFSVNYYRDIWYYTSKDLDLKQTKKNKAIERFNNYKNQPLTYKFPNGFDGNNNSSLLANKVNAAVIREKGSNSEREMAFMMSLAGFNVKDIHMTDIISGKENLQDIHLLVAVGGFSNSDVLGSAKGWAGSFLHNPIAKKSIDDFFKREDTMSLGVCNGCQLFIELGLINEDHSEKPKMAYNDSNKFECVFSTVDIKESPSIMLKSLEGSRLGVWSAHGEGKFVLPYAESKYSISGKYSYDSYPGNPNGSNFNTAMLVSNNGRHLVMMPHIERSLYPHNWAYYPRDRDDLYSPWIKVFNNSYEWLTNKTI
ncbi:MAG: phosphoribosylformylglycinamidine synthase [Cryomorphaceae bacterium MED-G11]|nr:MAG: phosphoribosylformylglycinamidine synthase [Cryomorphaceae bacterium MED-G11]